MVDHKRCNDGVLNQAMQKLDDEVRNGLKHGFFECTITCEVITDRKRRLTIKTGKSYRFTVGEEELQG
jgi:hypothetical protein